MSYVAYCGKKIYLIAFFLIGVLIVNEANAQDCKVSLSQSDMNFGRIVPPAAGAPLESGGLYALGNRTISLNAVCPMAANLMVVVQGIAQGEQFKFAQGGQLSVTMSNALLDGRRVDLAQVSRAGAAPGPHAPWISVVPGDNVVAISDGLVARGSVLSVQIEVRPVVPVAELRTRDSKVLETNVVFDVLTH